MQREYKRLNFELTSLFVSFTRQHIISLNGSQLCTTHVAWRRISRFPVTRPAFSQERSSMCELPPEKDGKYTLCPTLQVLIADVYFCSAV